MSRNSPGVAEIFRRAGSAFRERLAGSLDAAALKVMECIERCRTPALGGTVYRCTDCDHLHAVWQSCGNRHCPGCQGAAARRWMDKQAAAILRSPISISSSPYLARSPASRCRTASWSSTSCSTPPPSRCAPSAPIPGASGPAFGATTVLHTWNQKLEWHPHLQCLVPYGGFDVSSGDWKVGSNRFFAPVKVLASYFRRRVLEEVAKAHANQQMVFHGAIAQLADPRAFSRQLKQARKLNWNVYAKPPFNGPEAVIRHLSRYTHRVAISDARILSFDGDTVTFRCRKPVSKATAKPSYGTITLPVDDFLRRFLLHCIPKRFHRIRHVGILANGCRDKTLQALPQARRETQHDAGTAPEQEPPVATPACPICGSPSQPVLTLSKQPPENPDIPGRITDFIRKRGPPWAQRFNITRTPIPSHNLRLHHRLGISLALLPRTPRLDTPSQLPTAPTRPKSQASPKFAAHPHLQNYVLTQPVHSTDLTVQHPLSTRATSHARPRLRSNSP